MSAPGRNYHLAEGSIAIDFCDAAPYQPTASDIDGGVRGGDDPGSANAFPGAIFDIDSDEFGSGNVLMIDGFESGDVSAWQ